MRPLSARGGAQKQQKKSAAAFEEARAAAAGIVAAGPQRQAAWLRHSLCSQTGADPAQCGSPDG